MKTEDSEKFRVTLGNHLDAIRKRKGISEEELAEKANMKPITIVNVFKGKFSPPLDIIFIIAKAMDALDEVFAFKEE